ncbi:uncharacterized protein ARB_06267 [Trichophyton benhamiae CBS 112371]|uniref:Uncharacterized protein n=1 Tax=Arthroderma benhamiae (strain ATCC MYA-4681 / CBS 112371) TaxID=663331 RepID=D4APU9_ARTBC|nr:uncharacterized protein ARB_06267 [Trichophyton benhamiae CBS 112371]EFE35310.1 hypothetical protein ARB_06267 [Trichophyton benhamiae CBS 112371]
MEPLEPPAEIQKSTASLLFFLFFSASLPLVDAALPLFDVSSAWARFKTRRVRLAAATSYSEQQLLQLAPRVPKQEDPRRDDSLGSLLLVLHTLSRPLKQLDQASTSTVKLRPRAAVPCFFMH